MKELPKNYNSQEIEKIIYSSWIKSGYFNPDKLPEKRKECFTIMMPPPNANDPLHIGHAVFVTLEDLMTRYNRMMGKKTLWLPGADHAGFETQVVYEKKLEKQGMSRFDMSREEFYNNVWNYTQENRKTVKDQLEKLGSSCDWSRDTFTLDKNVIKTTYQTFKRMADEGLVYRGERMVNYCTKHKTAFSELEIEYEEKKDPLYYFSYGPINVATVRPETKFGDTAIAVHPEDKRYKKYIGKELLVKTLLGEKKIKVIADKFVNSDFGTGAVKITPAHDFNDFEIWERHKKEIPGPIKVINEDGKMNENTGLYKGMKVLEARKKVVEDMEKIGMMIKIDENYTHSVSVCYKCKNTIEPILKKQWFINVKPLTKKAIEAVKNNEIAIIPKNYEKVYYHWLRNLKDWNISRQNWWGINIPAWKCSDCSTEENEKWIITNGENPLKCKHCKSKNIKQDTDVFDTWFSSGQWPFAALKYPDHKDFKNFYPTTVIETGYDILPFWVIRMVMLGIYVTKKIPFKYIYLHGLVRDKHRQKMSKSKGNAIDPVVSIENYGADALRMSLIVGNLPGKDVVISDEKIKGYRNFINKLWNIFRFISFNIQDYKFTGKIILTKEDKKIIKEFNEIIKKVTEYINDFKFSHAAETLYHYTWHTFADKILENSKEILQNKKTRKSRQYVLVEVFGGIIKMFHPFTPFITEEIYKNLPLKNKKDLIIIENWPKKFK